MGALAEATELKPAVCKKALESLAEIATKEVKSTGKFTIPGLCMLKTRKKPAVKAGKAWHLRCARWIYRSQLYVSQHHEKKKKKKKKKITGFKTLTKKKKKKKKKKK